jgi:hypothetical protein
MFGYFVWYVGYGIATAGAAWVGLAAFLTGLKRFGIYVRFPLWLLFFILWIVSTFVGLFGGTPATKIISLMSVSVLIIGILFYLISLPLGKSNERKKLTGISDISDGPEVDNLDEFIALLKSTVNENRLDIIPDKDLLAIYQKAKVVGSYDPELPKIINTFKDELVRRGLDAEKKCPSCKMMVPDEAIICPCCKEKFISQSQKTPLLSSALEASGLVLWSCITRKSTLLVITLLVLLGLAFMFRYDMEYIHGTVYRYDRFTSTVEIRRTEEDAIKWVTLPRLKNLQHVREVRTQMVKQGGGMVINGPMSGTILPGSEGGMVVGGPMSGTILPGSKGGMVVGGPMSGTILPGSKGGMVVGGPMSGTILPGSKGGMVVGGPMSGTILPPR